MKKNKYYYFYVDLHDNGFSIINPTGDKNGRLNRSLSVKNGEPDYFTNCYLRGLDEKSIYEN